MPSMPLPSLYDYKASSGVEDGDGTRDQSQRVSDQIRGYCDKRQQIWIGQFRFQHFFLC